MIPYAILAVKTHSFSMWECTIVFLQYWVIRKNSCNNRRTWSENLAVDFVHETKLSKNVEIHGMAQYIGWRTCILHVHSTSEWPLGRCMAPDTRVYPNQKYGCTRASATPMGHLVLRCRGVPDCYHVSRAGKSHFYWVLLTTLKSYVPHNKWLRNVWPKEISTGITQFFCAVLSTEDNRVTQRAHTKSNIVSQCIHHSFTQLYHLGKARSGYLAGGACGYNIWYTWF